MFRRKEDGSDSIDTTTDTDAPISFGGTSGTPASTASTPTTPAASSPMNATTPATPTATAPAAQPAPAFRPAAPAAAIAAANRTAPAAAPLTAATPAAPQAVASTPAPAPAERMPAAPLARPQSKRVLTVGPEIQMKGEVTSCDRVIIEGTVDATMRDVHTVELAESGSLKGTAEVEDAEISGSFEGDLVVRGRLTVYSSGRVRGNVTYGEIEIQRGGQISGNIRNVAEAKQGAAPASSMKPKAA